MSKPGSHGRKHREKPGRPARKILPPIRLTSPPKPATPTPPPVAPVQEVPQVPIDAAFWRPLMLGLGTQPMGTTKLRGATGIEHKVIEVGVDEARKRLVVLNDSADPMVSAFIQSDLQRALPDQKVIVARTLLLNLDSSVRKAGNGLSSITVKRFMEMVEKKELDKDMVEHLLGGIIHQMMGDPKVKFHSPGAFFLQLVNQVTKFRWSSLSNIDPRVSTMTLDSLLPGDESNIESQLGICTVPIHQVTADQVENVKASTDLQVAREVLLQLGVWGYFFPDSADLTLGLIDHGIDTPEDLRKAIALAPANGHLIAESEAVPRIEDVLAALTADGRVAEAEFKLKVTAAGAKTRATIKLKPQESIFVKLKNLAGVVPLLKMFFPGSP